MGARVYQSGELVVYGGSGVCRVAAVGEGESPRFEAGKCYYTLCPLYGSEVIYVPVDTKAHLWPALTREEAVEFIHTIPAIQEEAVDGRSVQVLTRQYQLSFQSHERADLVRLLKTIYARNAAAQVSGKRPGRIDEKYMRLAEDLLHGELAAALDVPREEIGQYIADTLRSKGPEPELA